jgi:uncharacterized protein YceK
MKWFILLLAIGVVSGCASIRSSGALNMGPDTYSISVWAAPIQGGVAGAKQRSYQEASAKCAESGEQMLVMNEHFAVLDGLGTGSDDLTFQCLAPNDPGLATRPNYQKPANVIIQNGK